MSSPSHPPFLLFTRTGRAHVPFLTTHLLRFVLTVRLTGAYINRNPFSLAMALHHYFSWPNFLHVAITWFFRGYVSYCTDPLNFSLLPLTLLDPYSKSDDVFSLPLPNIRVINFDVLLRWNCIALSQLFHRFPVFNDFHVRILCQL